MFFLISKILGFLAAPSTFLVVGALVGVGLLLTPWRRLALTVLVGSVLLLGVFGFSPLSNVLLLTLSERFPAWQAGSTEPDGVIVLGGAIDPEVSAARGQIELDSAAERMLALLTMARRFPKARIVFTGGSGNLFMDPVAETRFAKELLADFAMTGDRFVFEEESRTTYENARNTFDLLKPGSNDRYLLVTSSFHMPRSIGAFRQVGFDVEAYPVDWRTRGWRDATLPFDRVGAGLSRADAAVHEWIGLVAYWLTGRSSELLPGPRPAGCDNAAGKDNCRAR